MRMMKTGEQGVCSPVLVSNECLGSVKGEGGLGRIPFFTVLQLSDEEGRMKAAGI